MNLRSLVLVPLAVVASCSTTHVERPALAGRLTHSRLTDGFWQIWQTDLSTGAQTQLTTSPIDKRYPVLARSGEVLFHTSVQASARYDPATGNEETLFANLRPLRDVVPAPDGQRYVFSKIRTDVIDASNLWVCDRSGGGATMITEEAGIQGQAAWSPDGQRLAFMAGTGFGTYEIWTCDPEGGDRRRLTENAGHEFFPAWSPDGKSIAYSSDVSGNYEIWVMAVDGSGARALTNAPGLDSRPAWSPDGRSLAFTTNRRGRPEVWVMTADGNDPRPLIETSEGACDPDWR